MIRAGVDGAQRIAAVGEVEIDLLHNRIFRVGKVAVHKPADARRHLIHQPGRLAEVHVLRVLAYLRDLHSGDESLA